MHVSGHMTAQKVQLVQFSPRTGTLKWYPELLKFSDMARTERGHAVTQSSHPLQHSLSMSTLSNCLSLEEPAQ
jgi:hypothetical protein